MFIIGIRSSFPGSRLPTLAVLLRGLYITSCVISHTILIYPILIHSTRLCYPIEEATSALDLENEKAMYDALNLLSITYVSVGHRPSLLRYHSKKLVLLGPGLPPRVVDVTASESAIEMMDLVGTSL